MPSSCAARTTRRKASTPRRWPSARGKPRAAAQRPLPSMMSATCNGASLRPDASLAGAAMFGINLSLESFPGVRPCRHRSLNGEDFLFLGREQLIDFRNHPVGCLLHIVSKTLVIVFGNLVVLLELLDGVETIAANVANRDFGG